MSNSTSAPRLTIGLATYDDYDGVYFTVQALLINHPELVASLEILIVDNHPEGPAASALQALANALPGVRYIAFSEIRSTAVRDVIFREAQAPSVLCLDSHVLLTPGSLLQLIEYLEARPNTADLLHGPLLYDDHRTLSTHFDPVWSAGMYGVWATDDRGLDTAAPPFEIPMQGLGLFACHTRAWPGLNPRFRGFGGEEGYVHEKVRQRGGRVLCLPFLRWLHRFQRPGGIPFGNTWEDRIRNYLIGHHELGLSMADLEAHFRSHLGDNIFQQTETQTLAEIASPWSAFDAVYAIDPDATDDTASPGERWRSFSAACDEVGLSRLLRWDDGQPASAAAVDLETVDLRIALRHRHLAERSLRLGFDSVLLIDPNVARPVQLLELLPRALEVLQDDSAAVLIHPPESQTAQAPQRPLWAAAYARHGCHRLCADLPREPEALAELLSNTGGSFGGYLESKGEVVSIR